MTGVQLGLVGLVIVLVAALFVLTWRWRGDKEAAQARAESLAQLGEEKKLATSAAEATRNEMERREGLLDERSQRLDVREQHAIDAEASVHAAQADLRQQRRDLEQERAEVASLRELAQSELERIAGLSMAQAVDEVVAEAQGQASARAAARAREIEEDALHNAKQRASEIIVTAIQRTAAEQTADTVITAVDLPNDEMKGRIIGREGRNIRSLEQVTGTNIIIDDSPGMALISCFDPVRREAARLTLQDLVNDGRIHPARIEEVHARSEKQVADVCLRAARDAISELNLDGVDPALLPYIGALKFRTSYGQNVLGHVTECGRLAGTMAAELGLNIESCTRAAFLHDIGKSLITHGEGSHALEGAQLAKLHHESDAVVNAIASHHNEIEPNCVEAVLTQAADAISGSRPGARRESMESYVKRLDRLEEIALSCEGVDRVFAMQAGRELRVMVLPEVVSEDRSRALANEIAQRVESELTYPGNIQVTVIRESRATAVAH